MPTLAVIFGITIFMNFDDHPPPHFHARSGGIKASYTLDGELLNGSLSTTQNKQVREWAQLHRDELERAWEH